MACPRAAAGTFGLILFVALASAQAQGPAPRKKSVAETRLELIATPGTVTKQQQDGWFVVEDRANRAVWSFVPNNHDAYPAVVKRSVVTRADGNYIDMDVICEAPKAACDRLVEDFKALNAETIKGLQKR